MYSLYAHTRFDYVVQLTELKTLEFFINLIFTALNSSTHLECGHYVFILSTGLGRGNISNNVKGKGFLSGPSVELSCGHHF